MPTKRPTSSDTRARIQAAARKIFAEQGYDRATIRMIAAEANIHASMVMRYFGTKEALFATAARFDLALPDVGAVPPDQRGVALVQHFINRWENGDGELIALLRAAVSHAEARSRMIGIFEEQLATAIATIGDPATATRRAALIASQMLGLALIRYVLKFDAARDLDRSAIVLHIGGTIQSYLDA